VQGGREVAMGTVRIVERRLASTAALEYWSVCPTRRGWDSRGAPAAVPHVQRLAGLSPLRWSFQHHLAPRIFLLLLCVHIYSMWVIETSSFTWCPVFLSILASVIVLHCKHYALFLHADPSRVQFLLVNKLLSSLISFCSELRPVPESVGYNSDYKDNNTAARWGYEITKIQYT
jgi:hypothetical protein